MSCAVEGCKSHSGRKENAEDTISFHRFPKNYKPKKIWIQCINRPNWTWNQRSHICSKHFTPDSFIPNESTRWRRLKSDALPTLLLPQKYTAGSPVPMNVDFEHVDVPTLTQGVSLEGVKLEEGYTTVREFNEPSAASRADTRSEYDTSRRTACRKHDWTISKLQKELKKSKQVAQRRLRKINTLTKRLSRIVKRNHDLYHIITNKLNEDNVHTEYLPDDNGN